MSSGQRRRSQTGSADNDDVPKAMLSQQDFAATAAFHQSSSNPFDFDVDFSQVQKRRDRAKAAKESKKQDDERPILLGMDEEDELKKDSSSHHKSGTATQQPRRPNIVQRAKTTGTDLAAKATAGKKSSFFGIRTTVAKAATNVGFTIDEEPQGGILVEPVETSRDPIFVGSKRLAVWPYDDYHLLQKVYYEKLEEQQQFRNEQKGGDDNEEEDKKKDTNVNNNMMESSIPIFSRPADPPDIPTAVRGLALTDFEAKAEQRAIAIVSTWLFDAGLIDELLVNGGMTGSLLSMGLSSLDDAKSVPSQEGVEIGQFGNPIEGSTKMDKEIAKLRNTTKKQLSLINARLNEGVAATGSEVQELVNAVMSTKSDISRLRELSTYVSNQDSMEETETFMLTKYPKLKQAINARRNLARCFRELDFFSQIPSTCDRLREELHAGEWTAHEWSSLRSVCREHVELEIFLVEAEAGMKKRLEDDAAGGGGAGRQRSTKFGRQNLAGAGLQNHKNDLIDKFLAEHVENVWELGDEIRMRIMSGIANSFDLAMNNPAGMVALVEAVEAYEQANDEYKLVHGEEAGGTSQTLRFTDMRAAALGELYKDFETRGLDVFRELTTQAADVAEEEEASNQKFSAVLRAANELTSEIGVVKEQMAPCFPPNWSIETLWTTCVAHVCSNNILQQIGGPDGHQLPDLTVTQLLDLVAWVENFREIIEETFPNIGAITSSRTYLDQPPKLLVDNNKTVDIEVAKDSLAWVNNTLWDVHDLAKDEFLLRTKEQTEEWLDNVYDADHTKNQTAEGRLVTSLCEDVYSLAGVQLRTIRERLTRRSEALVQAVGVIFKNLYEKQMSSRDHFCVDFETCCAASNDFIRMSEKCEEIVEEIKDECNLSPEASEILQEQAAALLGLYSGDAVYAAQKTHVYCFEPIAEAISDTVFRPEWLDDLTSNELALTLVRTLDDFTEDLETFLDEVMVQKTLEAQIGASINYYIKMLLSRASEHNSGRASFFSDNEKALMRMRGDVLTIREYFEGQAESMPTLTRVIEKEFDLLEAVLELLSIASGISKSDPGDFILVLQKRIRNIPITKFVVGDLYHLVKPNEEKAVYDLIDSMEDTMMAVAPTDEKALAAAKDRMTVPGLRIDQLLAQHCDESKRKRPLKSGYMEKADAVFNNWRVTWNKSGELGEL